MATGLLFALATAPAQAQDPAFTFTPQPPPPPTPIVPPPTGYLNGPCGVAVDSGGRFYLADHYHDRVDVYSGAAAYGPTATGATGYITQLDLPDDDTGPCYLAADPGGDLYVGAYHGEVRRYSPNAYPPTAGPEPPDTGTEYSDAGQIDSGQATGLAVDSTGDVYVAHLDRVSVYDAGGAHQLDIGLGSLGAGYGVAVSAAGEVYVTDAADQTVKVYDPGDGGFPGQPSSTIDGPYNSPDPPVAFSSLRDASLAVEQASGDLYLTDNTQPAHAEQPRARVHVFDSGGAYQGHLKHDVVHGAPTGLAVDNSSLHPGRVYVTSGNTHLGGLYAYDPGAAITDPPEAPSIPPLAPGGGQLFPPVSIGSAADPPGGIACEGDNCQVLPPEPVDPTLTTLLQGLEEPKVRYRNSVENCASLAKAAQRLPRLAGKVTRRSRRASNPRQARQLRRRAVRLRKRGQRAKRAARRCSRAAGGSAVASASSGSGAPASGGGVPSGGGGSGPSLSPAPSGQSAAPSGGATTQGLLPGTAGFDVAAWAADGTAATQAGSHPYSLEFTVGLDPGEDLSALRIELPPGFLLNPAFSATLCSLADFTTPRSATSPFPGALSGESCPDRSQAGAVQVTSSTEGTRRFGLFAIEPAAGSAFRLGASPFGHPLVFEAQIDSDQKGTYSVLEATDVPQALQVTSLALSLWGAPWDASHNTRRGDCLNEANSSFAWCKSSVGEPENSPPRAFLTLPTECRDTLAFAARVSSHQQGAESAGAVNRDSGGEPAPITGCSELISLSSDPEGFLSVRKASSASGFTFRFFDEDPGLANPRARAHAQPREAVIELPDGVTLNPSLGAGLKSCSPAQLANETAFNPPGAGCPNGAKIGEFRVRLPFYDDLLSGGLYLAKPKDNPFDTLLAVYLVAKSADRGLLIAAPGKLVPDPSDGTLIATFDDLPQLPFTDLQIDFRSGQRAPLVSPPSGEGGGCGWATTRSTLIPWAQGAEVKSANSRSPITAGIDFGPCPDGSTPPFDPEAVAGGVNSNVGSYTPYYVRLSRDDEEQEITSYSLVLPKGITGKLAGVPFCSEAAIARARSRQGFDEIADPSCPSASQVGRTNTGYGVGPALTYAPGRIYLAGPYNGEPLSLVTVNAATVGPFDLGTIVIRSAFSIDPRTAQLEIDSSASDPIPHIIDGIPLHLRDIRITMDRFQFTRNPTSCRASELVSRLTGSGEDFGSDADDSSATVAKHFQLLNCLNLGFTPRLGLQLLGGVKRSAYPALRAVLRAKDGDASLKRMELTMPKSLFLAQNHIRGVCTRPQFNAERCPANSIYGRAVVYSSLFDEPLKGPVYLRSSDNRLPDLVASLRSGEVRIALEGRIGPSKQGGVRAFFDDIPDAPIEAFVMQLNGGRRGLLVNSVNVCNAPPQATVKALGQNNKGVVYTTKLRGNCKKFKAAQKRKRLRQKRRAAQRRKRARARARSQTRTAARSSAQLPPIAIAPAQAVR